MGMIGRWIDDACKREPEVMRRVLGRKFGELRHFIVSDQKCGCLIGSWGLERGDEWATNYGGGEFVPEHECNVGSAVFDLTLPWVVGAGRCSVVPPHKRPDAFVIRLLKQRIRKALGIAPVAGERVPTDLQEIPR